MGFETVGLEAVESEAVESEGPLAAPLTKSRPAQE